MDQFDMSRRKALLITIAFMVVIGGLSLPTGSVFSILDLLTNNYILTIGAFIISIFVGWVWGVDNFLEASNIKSNFVRTWFKVSVKYISPVLILVIFIGGLL